MAASTLPPTPADQPLLQPGQKLGSYQVVRPLGQGGMGAVFEAVHQYIERRAAIKVLHPDLSQNSQFRTRFLNEARAVNLVKHPGLVEVFEFGIQDDGSAYIIMEYLEGESLTQRLARSPGGLGSEALAICRQLAQAMSAAHAKGIVHRDLKPDNVMLVADPERPAQRRVKVLDFGIAKLSAESDGKQRTETGVMIGTPAYMAPEQCTGNSTLDGKADVYALGVILYELLSGRLPYDAEHSFDFMVAHVRATPTPILSLLPELPQEVANLVHSMLAKNALERPSMDAVTALIDQLQAAAGVIWSTPEATGAEGAAGRGTGRGATPVHGASLGASGSKEAIAFGATVPGGYVSSPRLNKEAIELGQTIPGVLSPDGRLSQPSGRAAPSSTGPTPTLPPTPTQASEPLPTSRKRWLIGGGIALVGLLGLGPLAFRHGPATATPPTGAGSVGSEHAAATVRWVISSKPTGAEVVASDGSVLGSTPWQIDRPVGLGESRLTLRLAGHRDKSLLLSHSNPITAEVTLEAVAPSAEPTPPPSSASKAPGRLRKGKAKSGDAKAPDGDVKLLID